MKAVIIGATGATGTELLELLISDPRISEISALVRKPLSEKHPKLYEVVVDFEKLSNWEKHITGDVAFSCLGTTLRAASGQDAQYRVDYTYQYEFAKIARASKIPSFILISSSTANPGSRIFYSRMKGELEKAIRDLDFKSLVIFRPGPLIRPKTDRIGEKIGISVIGALNKVGIFRNMAPLAVTDLAALMLRYGISIHAGHQMLKSRRILYEVSQLSEMHNHKPI